MTRHEIENEYETKDGIIVSPGKFEAEPVYTPYFYQYLLEGFADDENEFGDAIFDLEESDIREFPELARFSRVAISEDDLGFVYCSIIE